ncbi:hypothetical protein ABL78_2864 [Leptomonas seymouri]|uniref:Uncharacterized protein n=1 Tax=Leptomonas seymouri TaxID=5684 RepID=A0A0N1HYN9_LEPSE|nr:hypothetical protein ABL78_2864 [Leptomonas seymouri]|eukprot:KPI88038.1 hypothetical protein ABL78_2864 [Leptomonas seymouri]
MAALEPSSSYLAYLRDVAHTTNASIAASVTNGVRAPHHQRQHRHRCGNDSEKKYVKAPVEDAADCEDSDEGYSYDYDYLREPPSGFLRGRHRRRSSSSTSSSHRTGAARPSAVRLHHTVRDTRKSSATATAAPDEKADSLQVSFEQMYAALKKAGSQEMAAAVQSRQTIHRFGPTSSLCSPPSTDLRKCANATSRSKSRQHRRVQFTADASAHGAPSSPACFQHSWSGTSLAIRVPPMPRDDPGRSGVHASKHRQSVDRTCTTTMSGSKALASTDTSAVTSSPTRLTSSSSSDTSSCLMAGTRNRSSPHRQQRQRASSSRRSAGFSCPYCCHRCDSCRCIGRRCQRHGSSARRKGAHAKTSPNLSKRVAGPPPSFGADAVRLKWPNQPEVCEPLLVPATPSRAASPTHRRHGSEQHTHEHPHQVRCRDDADTQSNEEVLRSVVRRKCVCYWAAFPEMKVAIHPSSHASTCPYYIHHALYDELMPGLQGDVPSSIHSYSSSTSPRPVEHKTPRPPSAKSAHGRERVEAAKSAPLRGAAHPASAHSEELRQLRQQRRRWLAEEAAAAKAKVQGRAAVMGSTKRRTYMEEIVCAAQDAPAPSKAATTSTKRKPQQQRNDGRSPSPVSVVDVTVASTTATAPPPPPLLPEAAAPTTSASLEEREDDGRAKHQMEAQEEDMRNDAEADAAPGATHEEQQPAAGETPTQSTDVPEAAVGSTTPASTLGQPTPAPIIEEPSESEDNDTTADEKSPFRALSRPRQRPAVGVPGPGAYHVDVAYTWSSSVHSVRGVAMPRAARMPPVSSITPGPGAYNIYSLHSSGEAKEDVDANGTAAGKALDTDGATAQAKPPHMIGKGIVFSSTSARQFQLQFGTPYQRDTTWAKRAAALPGPGAYNLVDGDRIDQSRPLGTAKLGFLFTKSIDGAHFTGFAPTEAARTATASAEATAAPTSKTPGVSGALPGGVGKPPTAASLVVPWRDWAGGAYIGTSTTAFWAHPSLAGGGRRALPRRGEVMNMEEEQMDGFPERGVAAAVAADAARKTVGGAWHGVGSGVALRLTGPRFPAQSPTAVAAVGASAAPAAETNDDAAAMERPRQSRGEPGPASYETEAALKFIQKRAPVVSMTFKHDRGPRGPLQSTAAAAAASDGSTETSAALPGPGTYDVVMSDVWGARRSPQWAFGTAARMPSSLASAVSAAAAATATLTGGAYDNDLGEQVPGPGAYYTDAAYRAVQPSAASAVMGAAPRFQLEASIERVEKGTVAYRDEHLVGPGTYDVIAAHERLHSRVKGGALPRAAARTREGSRGSHSHDGTAADGSADGALGEETVPGPGAYTLPPLPSTAPTAILGTTAPRFPWERMELEREGFDFTSNTPFAFISGLTPGPGAYDVDAAAHLASRPGTVIGRAPRSSLLVSLGGGSTSGEVGPGSYSLPPLPVGRSVVMSCGRSPEPTGYEPHDRDVPGPGLYDPVDHGAPAPRVFSLARTSARFAGATTAAGISATGLLQSGAVEEGVPGPGAYDADVPMGARTPRGSGVVFGTATRFTASEGGSPDDLTYAAGSSLVGPGSYDPYRMHSSAPTFSFPRGPRFTAGDGSNRGDADSSGGVGPGAYEVVDLSPPGRSAIMGSAVARPSLPNGDSALYANGIYTNSNDAARVPGPGAYSPQYAQIERSSPQVALARAALDGAHGGAKTELGSGPGPGQYDPLHPSDLRPYTHGHVFGSAPRALHSNGADVMGSAVEVPGPGAYEVRVTRDGQLLDKGGVGASGCPFGTAPRHAGAASLNGALFSPAADVPGPGAYTPEAYTDMGSRLLLSSGAAPRIGTAPRTFTEEEEAKWAIGPGPGAYETELCAGLISGPSITFPRAESRTGVVASDTPGPGAYAPESTLNAAGEHATRFGGAPRFPQPGGTLGGGDHGGNATPAPNAYSPVDAAVRAAAPVHRFGTAAAHEGRMDHSGAGRTGEGSSPNLMMASGDTVPGPGAYDVDGANRWVQSAGGAAAAYRFGTAARFGVEGNAEAADSAGVGPGTYSVDAGYRTTLPRAAAASIASGGMPLSANMSAEGGADRNNGAPGPGAYQLPPAFPEGPQWGFGTAPKHAYESSGMVSETDRDRAAAVGPGSYAVQPPPPLHSGISIPRALTGHSGDERSAIPGPGAYDVADAYLKSSTAGAAAGGVSIGSAPRYPTDSYAEGADACYGPGPGAYSPNIDASSAAAASVGARPGPAFPRAARMLTDAHHGSGVVGGTDASVGPGSYDLPSILTAAAAPRFGTAPRMPSASADGAMGGQTGQDVGPGTYGIDRADAQVLPRAPAHHIIASREYDNWKDAHSTASAAAELPGPGSYDVPVEVQSHARAALLLGRAVDSVDAAARQQTPGPGSYDLPPLGVGDATTTAAAHRFGRAPTHRLPNTSSNVAGGAQDYGEGGSPGPGAYDSAEAFHATQTRGVPGGFTMLGRPVDRELERRGAEPGPGAYDVMSDLQSGAAPSYSFGTAPRTHAAGNRGDGDAVGPGAYETRELNTGTSIRFTQAPRMWKPEKDGGVGQGPGPGAYDVETVQKSASPSFTIPRGPRPALRTGDVEASPMVGPGSYLPADGFSKDAAAAPTIGQAQRVWSSGNMDTPGPGSYDLQSMAAAVAAGAPSFGTSQRPDPTAGRCDTPGPGAYSAVSEHSSRPSGPSFSTAGRPDLTRNSNPGPCTYDQTAASALLLAGREGPSFGSSSRPTAVLNDNPGPGTYDGVYTSFTAAPHLRGEGPLMTTFSLAERANPVLNDNPGPGAYHTTHSAPSGPATSFGFGERSSPIARDTPGPGTYSSEPPLHAGPAPSFGFAERPSPILNSNPGPGAYHSAYAAPDGPAASFGYGERPSPVSNTNPGPGTYYREAYIAQLTDAPPGVGFGRAERPSPILNTNPGPGAYHREQATEMHPPTFGVAERPSPVLNTNPGPGAYYKGDYLTGEVGALRAVRFGMAERPSPILNTNPGPGAYFKESRWPLDTAGSVEGGFGKAERASPVLNDTPGPGAYYRGDTGPSASTPTRGVSLGTGKRPDPKLNDNPGPGAYFRSAEPVAVKPEAGKGRSGSAHRRRSTRPTAADTLRKLASVGYPLDKKPSPPPAA